MNIEKYNDGISGQLDIEQAILSQTKRIKKPDSLDYYNLRIKNSLYELFDK